jgi:predicted membrane channel-forming protein YqfA (hemolysin III family)
VILPHLLNCFKAHPPHPQLLAMTPFLLTLHYKVLCLWSEETHVAAPTQDDRQQAEDALSFIRKTMESATTYTALSGWGVATVGLIGFAAAWFDSTMEAIAPLRVWIPAAVAGLAASTIANGLKAHKLDTKLWSGSFRKIAWGLAPALIAGTFLTFALAPVAKYLVPGMWLSVYGAGVVAGSIFSIPALRYMGVSLLALGGFTLFTPSINSAALAIGFGGIHTIWGLYIVGKHGG